MAVGVLTTIEKARKKGFGEAIAKFIAIKIAEQGYTPIAFIDNTNIASYKLFQKIGFRKIGGSNWIVTEPSTKKV
jgi:predicted GNAT family acetyltransferase